MPEKAALLSIGPVPSIYNTKSDYVYSVVRTPRSPIFEREEEEIEEEIEEPIVEKEVTINIPKTEFVTRNDSIVNSKIDDISKAISLGDRFLFQRELFANNGELMQKTIVHLNSLSSIEEAYTYIQKKFTWDKESATTERFLQLISRRYL